MATISKTSTSPMWGVEKHFWETITQADVGESITPGGKLQYGSVQATGTFTSAAVALQGSNDGTNFVTVEDIVGNAASLSAAGVIEFRTTFLTYRLAGSGTTLDADVTMILRDA